MSLPLLTVLYVKRHPTWGISWVGSPQLDHQSLSSMKIYTIVANAAEKKCHTCDKSLQTIGDEDCWRAVVQDHYYCPVCWAIAEPLLTEAAFVKRDAARKMPHVIDKVMREIETHRKFSALTETERFEYEGAIYLRSLKQNVGEQNAFMRQLWRKLHYDA